MRVFLPLAAVVVASLCSRTDAQATVMVPLSIEEMARQAECVVRDRVGTQSAAWDPSHKRIYTTTQVELVDTIAANASLPKTLEIRTLGGEVGEIGMRVAGTPQFSPGEETVLFLRADAKVAGAFQVLGLNQGKFQVQQEAKGRWVVVANLEGIAFARPSSADGVLRVDHPNDTAPARLGLDEFRSRVLAARAPAVPSTPAVKAPASAPSPAPATSSPLAR